MITSGNGKFETRGKVDPGMYLGTVLVLTEKMGGEYGEKSRKSKS